MWLPGTFEGRKGSSYLKTIPSWLVHQHSCIFLNLPCSHFPPYFLVLFSFMKIETIFLGFERWSHPKISFRTGSEHTHHLSEKCGFPTMIYLMRISAHRIWRRDELDFSCSQGSSVWAQRNSENKRYLTTHFLGYHSINTYQWSGPIWCYATCALAPPAPPVEVLREEFVIRPLSDWNKKLDDLGFAILLIRVKPASGVGEKSQFDCKT